MPAIAWSRNHWIEVSWGVFAAASIAAMSAWSSWETIPFHLVWISLTLLYGFRVWSPRVTAVILAAVVVTTGGSILSDAFAGTQLWGELFEVPLMCAMFLAMVWHARRRVAAIQESKALADGRAALLVRQERFLHDVTHELRTPVTIARGHLELLQREGRSSSEVAVALDELGRLERIITRLLLLANAERPDFLATGDVDVEAFVEDVFMRWSEVAPRAWRLGPVARGQLTADEETLRIALDSLVENAVKYTEEGDFIELRAISAGDTLAIEVADGGCGIPPEARDRIFERFGRADDARARADGGVGLGLSIAAAIANAHGGTCTVESPPGSTVFALALPAFRPALQPSPAPSAQVLTEIPAT
jgi:two-component system OmpR family sensor kinase